MIARLAALLVTALTASYAPASTFATDFQVLAYHDVRDDVRDYIDADQYAISTRYLIDHFNWLRANGFTPVSVDQLLAAQRDEQPLPDKPVLLTFDDGFRSAYTHVFPLLKLFDYPAVFSVVTNWIDGDIHDDEREYLDGREVLTWDQVREMHASGLVEIASHSHDLHRGIRGNPQGNLQPAATTRMYLGERYETNDEYLRRIGDDLSTSREIIAREIGTAPRVMTWPYGSWNHQIAGVAAKHGMPITMTLDDAANAVANLGNVARHLVQANPNVTILGFDLLHEAQAPAIRAAQVDLDYVYDPDPLQQERNLGRLLDRMKALSISHVFLQAFADPDADGGAQALYFPNRHLPVRADLFNRVLWQLRTRSGVQVYAWLPVLSFEGAGIDPRWRVVEDRSGRIAADPHSEPRLSPFSGDARRIITEIYEDLAIAAAVDGIHFHDDGRLNEFEDASASGRRAYRERFGEPLSLATLSADPDRQQQWAQLKTRAIVDLTQQLMATVRMHRPAAMSSRNIFSSSLLHQGSEVWLAQDYRLFLETYDHVAVMAMPWFENAPDVGAYFEGLVQAMKAERLGPARTIFELQTVDWRHDEVIPSHELQQRLRWLQAHGVRHLAYYPDDFILGHPQLRPLREGMSLAEYPIEVPE